MLSRNTTLSIAGLFLLASSVLLTVISSKFEASIAILEQPVMVLVFMLVLSGIVFVYSISRLQKIQWSRPLMIWIFVAGFLMRLTMIVSTPMLEVDFNRYFWDGAVLANGLNPYQYSPHDVLNGSIHDAADSEKYEVLAEDSEGLLAKINHGYLRSIYPPMAQAAFALSYLISPWSPIAWKTILLFADLVVLGLILLLLKQVKLSPLLSIIYWWNPLLVKEIFNSGHMDVLVFPLLLSGLLLIKNRPYWAMVFLGASVGVKLWPVVLLPVFVLGGVHSPVKMARCVILFCLVAGLALAPQLLSGLDASSGLIAYSERWQLNDGFFKMTVWASQFGLEIFGVHPGHKYQTARIVVGIILLAWIIWIAVRTRRQSVELIEGILWIVSALFILIPTQFPWYYTWLVPFLTLRPRFSLLVYTITLPFYYLRYYLDARGVVGVFDNIVVWFEHVPIWILLAREWLMHRKGNRLEFEESISAHEA